MKLPANPYDFLIVQLDPEGGTVGSTETSADLKTGDGAKLPTIASGRWLPALSVNCENPEEATLEDLQGGDWLHITDVTGDTITMRRTETARTLQAGEYVFISLGAYAWSYLLGKVEQLEKALATRFGGYEGVPRYGADGAPDELKVEPTTPLSMKVQVLAGIALIESEVFRTASTWTSGTITAPTSNNRIDVVQAKLGTEGLDDAPSIKTGTEDSSPSAPAVDSDAIALAEIWLTPTTTSIEANDITDKRERI